MSEHLGKEQPDNSVPEAGFRESSGASLIDTTVSAPRTLEDLAADSAELATATVASGEAWFALLNDHSDTLAKSEIALRNIAFVEQYTAIDDEVLSKRLQGLSATAKGMLTASGIRFDADDTRGGLAKLQAELVEGTVPGYMAESVADLIRSASALFADIVVTVDMSSDMRYLADNTIAAGVRVASIARVKLFNGEKTALEKMLEHTSGTTRVNATSDTGPETIEDVDGAPSITELDAEQADRARKARADIGDIFDVPENEAVMGNAGVEAEDTVAENDMKSNEDTEPEDEGDNEYQELLQEFQESILPLSQAAEKFESSRALDMLTDKIDSMERFIRDARDGDSSLRSRIYDSMDAEIESLSRSGQQLIDEAEEFRQVAERSVGGGVDLKAVQLGVGDETQSKLSQRVRELNDQVGLILENMTAIKVEGEYMGSLVVKLTDNLASLRSGRYENGALLKEIEEIVSRMSWARNGVFDHRRRLRRVFKTLRELTA